MIAKLILNLYFWPAFALITVAAMSLAPLLILVNRLWIRMETESFVRIGVRIYGRILIILLFPFIRVRVRDQRGDHALPVIYTANHQSAIDPYLFGILRGDNGFITTWPFGIPLYSRFMKICSYINAGLGFDHVRAEALRLLGGGCSLIIWPEGHRSRDGATGRFKNGAFVIAAEAGVPVVPVCIEGSGEIMPPGARLLSPGVVTVTLLEPVYFEGKAGEPADVHRLKTRVRDRIISAMAAGRRRAQNSPISLDSAMEER